MGRRKQPPVGLSSVRLDYAVKEYLEDRRIHSAPGANTVPTYAVVMRGFVALFGADREVWTLTPQDFSKARTWFIAGASPEEAAQRKADGRKPRIGRRTKSSIEGMESVLRRFAAFAYEQMWLPLGVTLPKPVHKSHVTDLRADPDGQPMVPREMLRITEEDWSAVLEAADLIHPRCRAATAIAMYGARRVSELTTLQFKHIDWRKGGVQFTNWKLRRLVKVPLILFREELERWISYIEDNHGPIQPDWYVIPAKLHGAEVRGRGSRARIMDGSEAWPLAMNRKTTTIRLNNDTRALLAMFGYGPNEGTGTHTWRRSGAVRAERWLGIAATQALLDQIEIKTALGYTDNVEGERALWEGTTGKPYSPLRSILPDNWEREDEPAVDLPDNVIPFRRLA